jgi:hypothetical protein
MAHVWRLLICTSVALLLVSVCTTARANVVLDWSQTCEEVAEKISPRHTSSRVQVIAHLAVFNALNRIEPRFTPYGPAPDAVPGASPEAAVATAMFTALVSEPGVDHAVLKKAYIDQLEKVKDASAKAAGIVLGRQAALRLLESRALDRLERIDAAAHDASPGKFVFPPGSTTRASVTIARMKPFGIASIAAFDPGPPPRHDSEKALKDLLEIRAIGARDSNTRSADQTAAALFWNADPLSFEFTKMVRTAIEARKLGLLDTARLLALDQMIAFDSSVAEVAFKEKYGQWRPETAIAGPHAHANIAQANWKPLTRTPSQEEYPGGFPVLAGTLDVVLPRLYEMKAPINWRNPKTGQTRSWPDVSTMTREIGFSRLWSGVHFRTSIEVGLTLGQRVANDVIETQLRPLK